MTLLLSALVGYALNVYSINTFRNFYIISGSVLTGIYLLFLISFVSKDVRKSVIYKTVSTLFLFAHFAVLICFSGLKGEFDLYFILISLLMLIYSIIIYAVYKN